MKNLILLITFASLLACTKEESLKLSNSFIDQRCQLDPDPGLCEAYIPKYYFDRKLGMCKEFIWGGCGGVVPFNTYMECKLCLAENKHD